MTPKHIGDMIVAFGFTFMGISGQCNNTTFFTSFSLSSWFIDSGASNHMTSVGHNLSKTIP